MAMAINFVCSVALIASVASEPTDWERSYRVWFTKSFGDDHLCLTEIEFMDKWGGKMGATYKSQTSCYGCTSCDGCLHRYGNPLMQFDGIAGDDDEDAWTCTAPGTFVNSLGSQNVVFTLPQRPAKMVLARSSIDGDWIPTDWSLEEQQDDGTWWIIASVTDGVKALEQAVDVLESGGQPLYDNMDLGPGWTYEQQGDWTKNYPDCGGSEQSPIEFKATAPTGLQTVAQVCTTQFGEAFECDTKLNYVYEPMDMRALYNTGLGVQVAGNFGNLTLKGSESGDFAIYDVKQFHIHMPAEHKIGDDNAIGELHIVHQKRGSRHTDDLVMVSILLRLPREHEELVGTEPFFMKLGLDDIPTDGQHTIPFADVIDLNVFAPQLKGHFYAYRGSLTTPPCHENVQWYVMATPAVISGSNVVAFKARFPDPMNARERQPVGDRQILVDDILDYKPWFDRLMSA